ncbi:MAG: glutamine synthetase, partial [Anaplasmataceae bacterium]|nr:glutamine synthetase [Anaplasmataceae bacterium]
MIVSGDSLKCSDINSFNSLLSENSIKFIDFLFSDFDGQLKKATYRANIVNECDIMNNLDIRLFNEEGVGNQLKLRPIFQSVYNDPFSSHNSLGIICETDDEYDSRNLLKSAIK